MNTIRKLGQPSWRLASDTVEAFVTERGGHTGPVTFDRRGRKFRPYSVAPWTRESIARKLPPILQVLRGDFFCLPFGGNSTPFRGEKHPVHGETANARWHFESLKKNAGQSTLHLTLKLKIRPGRVVKRVSVRDGENVVYTEHVISGARGPMNPGHHAMLKFPDQPGSGVISTSRIVYGQVFPRQFEFPAQGGYSSLKLGAEFSSLAQVPMLSGESADLTRYPARRGFEDLVMVVSDPTAPLAWTAVTFPQERFVWFALKDPQILRQTVFWLSNGGRHYPPWNGRHINVLGLEEVTSWFHQGLAESARENPLSKRGLPTCIQLDPNRPLRVPYIMGIAPVPRGFDRVATIEAIADDAIELRSSAGQRVKAPVRVSFLRSS